MEFAGQTVLVYLEEDNVQRALFRVRPILCKSGPAQAQDWAALPDDGCLRIVPDKNEQHVFKERMRRIAPLCLMRVAEAAGDAGKIRTNKNYAPARGECNQFIVYSDAMVALDGRTVFEVLSADEHDRDKLREACTPFAYVRTGGHIKGPYDAQTGEAAGQTQLLPPDSIGLYAVTLPNGDDKLFYWPQTACEKPAETPLAAPAVMPAAAPAVMPAAAPVIAPVAAPVVAPVAAPAPAAPSEPAMTAQDQIRRLNSDAVSDLSKNNTAAPAAPAQPEQERRVGGTPLYRGGNVPAPRRIAHNPLPSLVEHHMTAQKYEAPGQALPQNAKLRRVQNPVEDAKSTLESAWRMPEIQPQLLDAVLKLPGMPAMMTSALFKTNNNAVVASAQAQLEDMEASRLSLLMQLDEANEKLDELCRKAMARATRDERSALDRLKNDTENAKRACDKMEAQREKLMAERDALMKEINQSAQRLCERVRVIAPAAGEHATLNALCDRVVAAMRAAGFVFGWDDAVNILTLLALSPCLLALSAKNVSDAHLAAHTLLAALGARDTDDASGELAYVVAEGGDALLAIVADRPASVTGECTCLLPCTGGYYADKGARTLPVACLRAGSALKTAVTPAVQTPVKRACLVQAMLEKATELPQETLTFLSQVFDALSQAGMPLPLCEQRLTLRYISACAQTMEGGVATALDYAMSAFVVPHIKYHQLKTDAVAPLLRGLPRALECLQ